jgi:hypothetical protein
MGGRDDQLFYVQKLLNFASKSPKIFAYFFGETISRSYNIDASSPGGVAQCTSSSGTSRPGFEFPPGYKFF